MQRSVSSWWHNKDTKKLQRMAYTKKNKYQRIIDIQDLTLEHTKKGVTQEWVYNNIVYPTWRISRRSYYNYLSINAKSELKKLEEVKKTQLILF